MKRIIVPEEGIETLFGSYDENLKHLESLFNVRIRTQGHDLLVEGESLNLDKVDRIIDQLSSLLRDGYKLSNADVKTASALVALRPRTYGNTATPKLPITAVARGTAAGTSRSLRTASDCGRPSSQTLSTC